MSFYLKESDTLWPTNADTYDVRNSLPVGTYTVGSHPLRGFFLKAIDHFEIKGKLYGDTLRHADRILNTFRDRPNSTGVMLNGEKGSGKTMLAKRISEDGRKQAISTLVINSPFCGDSFNTFIQSINEPCIIIFDEFEKVFDDEQQEAILTLMDGVFPSKKLFILTCNDRYKVNSHMRNRPGRIYYMIEYKGLSPEFIEEYCQDNLNNKSHIPTICRLTMMFDALNFDMLKAIVEEMNRYDETPNQVLELLNAKPTGGESYTKHDVKVLYKGKEVPADKTWPNKFRGIPVSRDSLEITVYVVTGVDDDGDEQTEQITLEFGPEQLRKIDTDSGTFTYVIDEGKPSEAVVVFIREVYKPTNYNWIDAF